MARLLVGRERDALLSAASMPNGWPAMGLDNRFGGETKLWLFARQNRAVALSLRLLRVTGGAPKLPRSAHKLHASPLDNRTKQEHHRRPGSQSGAWALLWINQGK